MGAKFQKPIERNIGQFQRQFHLVSMETTTNHLNILLDEEGDDKQSI
jgi:hypothetical protein